MSDGEDTSEGKSALWHAFNKKAETPEPTASRVEAQRGVPFNVFPEGQPIRYWHLEDGKRISNEIPSSDVVYPTINVAGLGEFQIPFSGGNSLQTPEEINHQIDHGERVVLMSPDGPIEITSSQQMTGVGERAKQGNISEIIIVPAPEGLPEPVNISLNLLFPKMAVSV